MKTINGHTNRILDLHIPGFHQFVLSEPGYPVYVSSNFLQMTGYEAADLSDAQAYFHLVHPADLERFMEFLEKLCSKEQKLTIEYRLLCKNGTVRWVQDTSESYREYEETMLCDSVLTDITSMKSENSNLQFLNETMPCGFLRYTCEKEPKITYANRKLLEILGYVREQEEIDPSKLPFSGNLMHAVPKEEQRRFRRYLNHVYTVGTPVAGDITIQKPDGSRVHLFGWVIRSVNERGEEEFQSACMDMTRRYAEKQEDEKKQYVQTLAEVYEKIFEYDFPNNTVKCLHTDNSPMFTWIQNIPMQLQEATERWISGTVIPEDRARLRTFFRNFATRKRHEQENSDKLPQITYRAQSSKGGIHVYRGVFIKLNETTSFYCCRRVNDAGETELLRNENMNLKETMQELALKFSDGIAAFELSEGELVTPLYVSDNVCEFFGVDKETWLRLMHEKTPLRDFAAHSRASYEDYLTLLKNGEAEFVYRDLKTQKEQHIRAICSQKGTVVTQTSRYVMLYNVDTDRQKKQEEKEVTEEARRVYIRTFGYFDVFLDGKAIPFKNKKSKELLALLVDRKGGFVTSEEAISFLWEDETVNPVTLSRYRKVALRMKNILEEYGITDIVESADGVRRIDTERVRCDLYDYLSGNPEYAQLFKGNYLTNYSWGETTLAELTGDFL